MQRYTINLMQWQNSLKFFKNADCSVLGTKKSEAWNFASMWGRVDSNHRTDSRTDLQSVAIATMRLPQKAKELLSYLTLQKYIFFPYPGQKQRIFSQLCGIFKDSRLRDCVTTSRPFDPSTSSGLWDLLSRSLEVPKSKKRLNNELRFRQNHQPRWYQLR